MKYSFRGRGYTLSSFFVEKIDNECYNFITKSKKLTERGMSVKCPKCSKEFADGLYNCPYCGHGILQDDSEGKFSVPKFTGSYKMANPRVKNQKEALKKINQSNSSNHEVSDNPVKFAKPFTSTSGLNQSSEKEKNITTTTATATNISVSGGTSDNVATARKKPLTREDLEAMQRNVTARSQNQASGTTLPERPSNNEPLSQPESDENFNDSQDDTVIDMDSSKETESTVDTEDSKNTGRRKLFGKKKSQKEKKEKSKKKKDDQKQPDIETYEEENEVKYDVNIDGYYDDLIPQLAHQINKIPQENIIKVIFIVIFVVVMCFIILYTS